MGISGKSREPPVGSELTPGQTSDFLGVDPAVDNTLPEPSVLLADRGHNSDSVRKTKEAQRRAGDRGAEILKTPQGS
jgi:hypothetical protein